MRAIARPRLLFISHVVPQPGGNGLAMRAWMTASAFAAAHAVTLLVVDHRLSVATAVAEPLRSACELVTVLPRGATPADLAAAAPGPYDAVHVFRLAARPTFDALRPALAGRPLLSLDLDDIESITQARIAAVLGGLGDSADAARHRAAAVAAQAAEAGALFGFDRVCVCSTADAEKIGISGGAEVVVLPNALPRPAPLASPPAGDPWRVLFLGTLGYPPNDDALRWFAERVWPLARAMAPRPLRFVIAGRGRLPAALAHLRDDPDVEIAGAVADVRPVYQRSHAAIVPLRAAGGTRIKAIEAFSLRRPVVGTTIGLEGLDVVDGETALVTDDPDRFAEALVRLAADPALAETLADRAEAHYLANFTAERLTACVAGWAARAP